MPNIVVLVKQVPDTYSERKLSDSDHTLDRDSADAVLDEINERAIEEALQIKEAQESVLAPYAGASIYDHQGERVVAGQRLTQAAGDPFLGWTTAVGSDRVTPKQ